MKTNSENKQYPAAHGCITGAMAETLKGHFGIPKLTSTVSSMAFKPAYVHTFTSTKTLEQEVEDARIYAGFHYHHSVVQGIVLGQKVAHQVLTNFSQPVTNH